MSASKTYVIGLTGGIGSGKSEAARMLCELGAVHADADAISRELTFDGGAALPAIRETFGDDVFDENGSLDRRALGAIVFADPAARRALEGIIHPRVQHRVVELIDTARSIGADAVIMDMPLLFETGMDTMCDVTWVITADLEKRIQRVIVRDGLTREAVEARINSQMSDEERARRATRVISNDGSFEKFKSDIANAYHQLIKNGR